MKKNKQPTKKDIIEDIKDVQSLINGENSLKSISRDKYREISNYTEYQFMALFGTFEELKRQAGLRANRTERKEALSISKHSSVDNLKKLSKDRKDWGDRYLRPSSSRYQLILGAADFHDTEVDPFFLRVFLDTARRSKPDVVSLGGDVFDFPEFSTFYQDPREWDQMKRLHFVHEEIFGPLREMVPKAQIDLIEGNHERRLLKNITNNSPSTRAFLSDWLDLTIEKALKLDDHKINYIAEGDLAVWSKRDEKAELAKNFKIYFDAMVVHHYTNGGRSLGFPGFSGHNHKHEMWNAYSPIFGPFEWHQIGCGHRRDARYTDGLKWHNGFILCHVDTKDKVTNFEYVPVSNHAVVGGRLYLRGKKEIVIPGRK